MKKIVFIVLAILFCFTGIVFAHGDYAHFSVDRTFEVTHVNPEVKLHANEDYGIFFKQGGTFDVTVKVKYRTDNCTGKHRVKDDWMNYRCKGLSSNPRCYEAIKEESRIYVVLVDDDGDIIPSSKHWIDNVIYELRKRNYHIGDDVFVVKDIKIPFDECSYCRKFIQLIRVKNGEVTIKDVQDYTRQEYNAAKKVWKKWLEDHLRIYYETRDLGRW